VRYRTRGSDPMLRRDILGPRRDRIAHADSGRREDVADEQTAHEGLPHLSHAGDADGVLSVHANPPEPPTLRNRPLGRDGWGPEDFGGSLEPWVPDRKRLTISPGTVSILLDIV